MQRALFMCLICFTLGYGGKCYLDFTERVKEPTAPNLKPLLASYQARSLENNAMGFNSAIGAFLWVQLLQKSNHRPVTSDEVSWEFAQLDALTELDPNNDRAYIFGSVFLSVLRRDKLGGRLFIEKWIKKHPAEWRPTYMLGSHYFLELNDQKTAAPLILRASLMKGAPQWMTSLGVRLLSGTGALFNAYKVSLDVLEQVRDPEARDRLLLRIRSLNYNLQKQNWEEALSTYQTEKKHAPAELADLTPYVNSSMRNLSSMSENVDWDETVKPIVTERFSFRYDVKSRSIAPLDPDAVASLSKVDAYDPPNTKAKDANKGSNNGK